MTEQSFFCIDAVGEDAGEIPFRPQTSFPTQSVQGGRHRSGPQLNAMLCHAMPCRNVPRRAATCHLPGHGWISRLRRPGPRNITRCSYTTCMRAMATMGLIGPLAGAHTTRMAPMVFFYISILLVVVTTTERRTAADSAQIDFPTSERRGYMLALYSMVQAGLKSALTLELEEPRRPAVA